MLRPIARRTSSSFDCTIGGSWRGSPTTIARSAAQARRVEQRRQRRHAGLLGDQHVEALVGHQRRQVRVGQRAHHDARVRDDARLEIAIGGGVRGDARLREHADALEPRDPQLDRAQLVARRRGRRSRRRARARTRATSAAARRRGGGVGEQRLLRRRPRARARRRARARSAPAARRRRSARAADRATRDARRACALDDVAELGAERLGVAAAEPDQRAGLDRGGEPRPRRELREHLIDRGVRRRREQDALALREQLLDHVRQRHGLAGAGRAPDEREVAVAAQLDRRALARVERARDRSAASSRRARAGACRTASARARRVALDVELVERLDQAVVEEPRRDDERDRRRGRRRSAGVASERDPAVVDALDRRRAARRAACAACTPCPATSLSLARELEA